MAKKNLYKDDSIITLSARDFCRLRPGVYTGDTTWSTQLVREIFGNALDEHTSGRGNIIRVEVDTKYNIYSVCDEGQGFPINVEKKDTPGHTILQSAFEDFNTSGKYTSDGVYTGSLGCNGQGSKLTNFLSKELVVYSSDGKEFERLTFKDGIFVNREVGKKIEHSGTKVTWSPDKQFFQNVEANENDLRKLFKDISALCPELTIDFQYNGEVKEYHSANGIQDLLDDKVNGKELLQNRFAMKLKNETSMFDIAMTFSTDYSESTTAYVNYGLTESGVHINDVRYLLAQGINKFALDNGIIKKQEDSLKTTEVFNGLVLVFNIQCQNVKYDSQTKTRVVDYSRDLVKQVIVNEFPVWLSNNPKDARLIIDRALNERKAKEAAQKARDGIRNAKSGGKKFIKLPTKLVDAFSKDRSGCELTICEGDSAANGIIAKRDGKTQAVFPIRGKILSCRKATPDKVYANQEISNIVMALGLDIDKTTGKLIYDQKKLRYGKIIIATDADSDGYQIRMLLINALWWLCQELVTDGHVYAAVPPLYRITTKKNEYIFLTGDKELEDYKKKHKNESFLINRNKGLGEMDSSELAQTIIRPATRNVQQILVEDAKATDDMLEMFMGNDVEPRRKYLLEHCSEVEVELG